MTEEDNNPILDTRISSVRPSVRTPSRLYYPPWILKRAVLESSGQRIISLNSKTERIALSSLLLFLFFFGGGGREKNTFFLYMIKEAL